MLRILRALKDVFRLTPLMLCVGAALTQCPAHDATLPKKPLQYPIQSDQYAVEYKVNGGGWTDGLVYISYYGDTDASPVRGDSPYKQRRTSMSFVSIPSEPNASVQIRVTMLPALSRRIGDPFRPSDHATVRPTPLGVGVETGQDGTVSLTTLTSADFNGEQFILWWERGNDGGGVEGLAFYLNPPYKEPEGSRVKVVRSWNELDSADLSSYQTLDFEPAMDVLTPIALGGDGTLAYKVPDNILHVFLGQDAWVQGKLRFTENTSKRRISGPGVLDGSRFNYLKRDCPNDDGLYSLSSLGTEGVLDNFSVDGIIISDQNHAADDPFRSSTLNNVKTLGWNSNNAALRLNNSTTATNVFIRSSDDSLMVWGSPVTVTNATVWQGYNGGVVNLDWSNNSVGDKNVVDGLWVVKTDWQMPHAQSWIALSQPGPPNPLNSQNNGVFTSLMVPTTEYGSKSPPVFRNIFVEDPPQVLFSLKIAPSVNCPKNFCTAAFLMHKSSVSLKIENLFSPQSVVKNSIGFQTLPANYMANGTDLHSHFPTAYTLEGSMKIDLTDVWILQPSGFVVPLTNDLEAEQYGKITTRGTDVNVNYDIGPP
jgi:hypothetical protein